MFPFSAIFKVAPVPANVPHPDTGFLLKLVFQNINNAGVNRANGASHENKIVSRCHASCCPASIQDWYYQEKDK